MIVCNEGPEMDDVVFIHCDLIKIGDAGYINENINALADTAFKFEN